MKTKLVLLLALLLVTGASARPPIESLPWDTAYSQLLQWRKKHGTFHHVTYPDLGKPNAKGDVLLVELYRGQPIAKGDLIIFKYKDDLTCREVGEVGAGYVKTLLKTKVVAADIHGIVRRTIRPTN